MIYVGTDIVEIGRIEKAVKRRPAFWQRILTEREIDYCQSKKNSIQSLAGRFAAKEAVLKCLGIGLSGVSWHDMEIVPDEKGAPQVMFTPVMMNMLAKQKIQYIKISISHSQAYAMSVAVGEGIYEDSNR